MDVRIHKGFWISENSKNMTVCSVSRSRPKNNAFFLHPSKT